MEYTIKQDQDIQAILVTAKGMINSGVAIKMVLAAGVELNCTNFQKCLFDLTQTELDNNQSMTGMVRFIKTFEIAGIKTSVKMAAVLPTLDSHRLALEKAANSERYKLKHFETQDEALNWLCM